MKKSGWLIEAICQVMAVLTAVTAGVLLYLVRGSAGMVIEVFIFGVFGVVFWYVMSGVGKCLKILEERK